MSRKLRILILSLAVVMFGAASAFAYFTSDDVDGFVTSDSDIEVATTEGYNYMQRVFIDPDNWPDGETPRTVTWEIDPNIPSWLEYTINGNEVVFRGVLPAYNQATPSYTVHVIAHLDCDVPQGYNEDGDPLEDEDGNVLTVAGHIAADADVDGESRGLVIEVEH